VEIFWNFKKSFLTNLYILFCRTRWALSKYMPV
jgi:hypothetical protein